MLCSHRLLLHWQRLSGSPWGAVGSRASHFGNYHITWGFKKTVGAFLEFQIDRIIVYLESVLGPHSFHRVDSLQAPTPASIEPKQHPGRVRG